MRGPGAPGVGVELDREKKLAEMHEQYRSCGVRNRDDLAPMRKYDAWLGGTRLQTRIIRIKVHHRDIGK